MRFWRLLFSFPLICPAQPQKPVLAWSAKLGPSIGNITATFVASDGSIYVVGSTPSGTIPGTLSFRNSDIFVGKIGADGASAPCTLTFGGTGDDIPSTAALLPDGSVLVAGVAQSPDFPPLPPSQPGPGQFAPSFLVRVNPCEQALRSSIYLPADVYPASLTVAPDGSIYLGALDHSSPDRGFLVRIDPTATSVVSSTRLRGVPGALTVDAAGSVYATGVLPPLPSSKSFSRQAFAAKFTAGLEITSYDLTFGIGDLTMGTALVVDSAGGLFIACEAVPPGSTAYNQSYGEGYPLPFYATSAALVRISAEGSVVYQKFVDPPAISTAVEERRPVAIGIGPDGRIWMAIDGRSGYPRGLPVDQRVPVFGILFRSFFADGMPTGADTLLPCLSSHGPSAVAVATGRIAAAIVNPYLPVTPGSNSSIPDAFSIVAFDLNGAGAPTIAADREIVNVDEVAFSGTTLLVRSGGTVQLSTTGKAAVNYVAAVVPNGDFAFTVPPPAFTANPPGGALPAVLEITAASFTLEPAVLVVMAPGAEGLVTVPVRSRRRAVLLTLQRTNWEVPFSDPPTKFSLTVAVSELGGGLQLNLPFTISHQTPWLTLDTAEGATPATFVAVVDPKGLARGTYVATLTIQIADTALTVSVPLTVGPMLHVGPTNPPPLIQELNNRPFTVKFPLQSTGAAIDFVLASYSSYLQISPTSGRTPQDIVATIDPAGLPTGQFLNASFLAMSGDLTQFLNLQFMPFAVSTHLPDKVDGTAAPGSLITFSAGTSRCEPAAADTSTWPLALGSCTLRVNGNPIPLGSIKSGRTNAIFALFDLIYTVTAQLPYDLPGPTASVEIEDENGHRNVLSVSVAPVAPIAHSVIGPIVQGHVGDEIPVKLSGLGAADSPAPLGDVASTAIRPLAQVEAFIGGRASPVRAQLSGTEVGIWDVRISIPVIAPDFYTMMLRIGGVDVPVGSVTVVP